jgi:hypothetical protein
MRLALSISALLHNDSPGITIPRSWSFLFTLFASRDFMEHECIWSLIDTSAYLSDCAHVWPPNITQLISLKYKG